MSGRRGTWLLTLVVCVGGACAGGPEEIEPAADAPAAAVAPGHTMVVGEAPPGAIVVLEPVDASERPPSTEPAVMDQYGLQFVPGFLIVRAGQPVEFRNSEDEAHNIRVNSRATKETLFNVAPPRGAQYTYTFEEPGFYDVLCDAHVGMFGTVLVTTSPYAVVTDEDGSFTFPEVESGAYTLVVSAGGERVERPIDISGERTEVVVDDR